MPARLPRPTQRQLDALGIIAEDIRAHGVAPSVREVVHALGLSPNSYYAAHGHIAGLLRLGLLSRGGASRARTYVPTEEGMRALGKVCPACGAVAHGVYMDLTEPAETRAFRCGNCPRPVST